VRAIDEEVADPAALTLAAASAGDRHRSPRGDYDNALPHSRTGEDLVGRARDADIDRAIENNLWIIRADIAGRTTEFVSAGSSAVVRPDGAVALDARRFAEDILVADVGGPVA
jgi:hypothetical protein